MTQAHLNFCLFMDTLGCQIFFGENCDIEKGGGGGWFQLNVKMIKRTTISLEMPLK